MFRRVERVPNLVSKVQDQECGIVPGRLGRQHGAETPDFAIEDVHLDAFILIAGFHLSLERSVGAECGRLSSRRGEERAENGEKRVEERHECLVPVEWSVRAERREQRTYHC